MPAAMMSLTVAAPSSTVGKSSSIVRTTGGFGVSRTQIAVAIAAHPLAADERAAQVVPGRLGILAAEHGDAAIGQHHLDGEDVARCDPVGEAMRPTGVVRDVAADRARLLAARIGREVESVRRDVRERGRG